jgi:hypothetical protein
MLLLPFCTSLRTRPQALQETTPIPIVREDVLAFNAGGNDVMKSPWSFYAKLAWHKTLIPEIHEAVILHLIN